MRQLRVAILSVLAVCRVTGQEAQTDGAPVAGVQAVGTEVRSERSVQMSEQSYRELTAIQELLAEGNVAEALSRIAAMQETNLVDYEEALLYQSEGYAHAQAEDYPRAITAFERSLAFDRLSNLAQQAVLYSLAGLLVSEQRFEEAIERMTTWLRYAQEPVGPEPFMLIASANVELTNYENALPYVQEAIVRAEEPNESWYMLELSIHFEHMDFPSAIGLLRRMVLLWPDNARYWEMLANAHLELEDDPSALATLMLAYQKGLVLEEERLLHLARLNLFLDIPFEAGRIVETGIAEGRIAEIQEHLELLLSAWTAAREFDRAIAVIDRLAPLAEDGGYYLQKAQLLNEQEDWPGVIDAAALAVERGGLARPGDAWVLRGMAHTELGEFDDAVAAFEAARSFDDDSRRNADAWIDYVTDRRQVAMSGR